MAEGAPFDAALAVGLHPELSDADRRLAHEIAAGVLRARTELDRRLAPQVKGAWSRVLPALQDVLRIGAYQLLKLERVPPHAAVQTAVELGRQHHGPRGARFVNAVLRALLRAAPAQAAPMPGDADLDALAQQESHPAWLVRRWAAHFGVARTAALLAHNNRRPPIALQPVRWTAERLQTALEQAGACPSARADGCGIEVSGVRIAALPGYEDGAFVVQDPAQARLIAQITVADGAVVWDACAAPGGKAAVLASRCTVLASDASRTRLERLRDTLRRTAPQTRLFAADARFPPFADRSLDAVLLDVPCSATGTMARHPDARWRISAKRIDRLARLQSDLLDGAAAVVRPGGRLVYMTCSLEPEENEQQVHAFLSRARHFGREHDDLMLVPGEHGTDGGFGAFLRRAA